LASPVPAIVLLLMGLGLAWQASRNAGEWSQAAQTAAVAATAFVAMLAALSTTRVWFCAAAVAGLGLPAFLIPLSGNHEILAARSFYGPLTVVQTAEQRLLVNGNTIHGVEWLDAARRTATTSYYEPHSGIGQLVGMLKERRQPGAPPLDAPLLDAPPLHALVIGLGSGTMACYGDAALRLSFVEIDPLVDRVAHEAFGFLGGCGNPRVEINDGRLAMAARPDASLDLVVVDAFSSDAVPAHLLTAEAIALYARKLRPGGVVAIHISNRYLDLAPVVAGSAAAAGLQALFEHSSNAAGSSDWTAVTADAALSRALAGAGWKTLTAGSIPAWHDDRWDLMHVIRLPAW
ncbi:MAG: spermidine synthase, partial [Janthinobacterium lividum]